MKRRHFCRYVALSSVSFTGVVGEISVSATKSSASQSKSQHKWVVLYWMPYDNDLVTFGEPILEMLVNGTKQSEVTVVVQSDYWKNPKMRRRQMINGNTQEIYIAGKDSSSISAFSEYLDWANQTFEAEHWVVIILGHGGKINEISPDDRISPRQIRTWMRVDQMVNAIKNFNQSTNGCVEILYFQNCNKATLEVAYEARDCARYTLASQLNLGAPNYYYKGFLNQLKESSIDGREAAIAIMNSERVDMYHTLTLIDNEFMKKIPEKLSQLLQSILNSSLGVISQSDLSTYNYSGEKHCDVLVLLGYLSQFSRQGQHEFTEFAKFLHSSVITAHKIGGKLYGNRIRKYMSTEKLCGLSMYLPIDKQEVSRYSSLALYQEIDLVSLYRKIVST
jgi:hypothetical protein